MPCSKESQLLRVTLMKLDCLGSISSSGVALIIFFIKQKPRYSQSLTWITKFRTPLPDILRSRVSDRKVQYLIPYLAGPWDISSESNQTMISNLLSLLSSHSTRPFSMGRLLRVCAQPSKNLFLGSMHA